MDREIMPKNSEVTSRGVNVDYHYSFGLVGAMGQTEYHKIDKHAKLPGNLQIVKMNTLIIGYDMYINKELYSHILKLKDGNVTQFISGFYHSKHTFRENKKSDSEIILHKSKGDHYSMKMKNDVSFLAYEFNGNEKGNLEIVYDLYMCKELFAECKLELEITRRK